MILATNKLFLSTEEVITATLKLSRPLQNNAILATGEVITASLKNINF